MQLLTLPQRHQLLQNGRAQRAGIDRQDQALDFEPIVKLFTPDANATWLLTELNADSEDLAFGLCDLGLDEPELGYVSLAELAEARGPLGLPIERDLTFAPTRTIAAYASRPASIGASSPSRPNQPPAFGSVAFLAWPQPELYGSLVTQLPGTSSSHS